MTPIALTWRGAPASVPAVAWSKNAVGCAHDAAAIPTTRTACVPVGASTRRRLPSVNRAAAAT
jgi:hypothetical protein